MTTRTTIARFLVFLILLCGLHTQASAADKEYIYQSRLQVGANFDLASKLDYTAGLQFYFSDLYDFSSYQLGNSFRYRLSSLVSVGTGYNMNISHDGGTELNHQYSFNATFSKRYGPLVPSFRLYYSNYFDSDINNSWGRIRGRLVYNIPNSHFSPYVSAEPTYDLAASNICRITYMAGTTYSMTKGRQIHAYYRIDDYKQTGKFRQVFALSYRLGF